MIGRRQFLTGGSVLAAAAPIGGMGAAPPSDLHFEVFRNDSRIGHHAINFHTEGDTDVYKRQALRLWIKGARLQPHPPAPEHAVSIVTRGNTSAA